jgi:hypothetical protein
MPKGIYQHKKLSENHKKNIGKSLLGHSVNKITREKLSFIMIKKGIKPPSKLGKKWSDDRRIFWSQKQKGKKGHNHTIKTRKKLSKMFSGENGSNWKGGITPILENLRRSVEYKIWREKVFKRDNYTCKICGKRGEKLNADHIKSFRCYPKLRFVVSNGRTLCLKHHLETDNYGGRTLSEKVISDPSMLLGSGN